MTHGQAALLLALVIVLAFALSDREDRMDREQPGGDVPPETLMLGILLLFFAALGATAVLGAAMYGALKFADWLSR